MEFKRIKDLKEEKEMTQTETANKLNVKRSAYSLWELGINTTPLNYLNTLCNLNNCSMDYVLGLTDIKYYTLKDIKINTETLSHRLKEIRKKKIKHKKR